MENLTEYIINDECFEKEDIDELINKIPDVKRHLEILKDELITFLKNSDINVLELLKDCGDIQNESSNVIVQADQFLKELEKETKSDIFEAVQMYYECASDLEKENYCLGAVENVLQAELCLQKYNDAVNSDCHKSAVEMLTEIKNILLNPVDGFQKLSIYKTLDSLFLGFWDDLVVKLGNEWDKRLIVTYGNTEKKETLGLCIRFNDSIETAELLYSLHTANILSTKMKEFGVIIVDKILTAIIMNDCNVYEENDDNLVIKHSLKNKQKPHYLTVLENLKLIFKFLNKKLNMKYSDSSESSLMSLLGVCISLDFAAVLIRDCLMDTIPSSIVELQNYGKITSEIEKFQHFLTNMGFFPSENFSILQYANNIDVLFAEKSCQYFLETARNIMMKDLNISMSIGVENASFKGETSHKGDKESDMIDLIEEYLPKSLYYFPRCMISKSTQELLDLMFVMMEQASLGSKLCCEKLYLTTRLIFELYDAVIPIYHEKFLQTIPYYVALFHNNCFYLAHNCLTLGEKWMMCLGSQNKDFPITFLDLVPKLRTLGLKHISSHLQLQRNQILDNIRSSDLSCIVVKDVLGENVEQAIRQCLRQLQLLKNVWIGVLPLNVFTRLLACLVNMFVDELIHRVCTVEDISAEMAAQLGEFYSIVIKKLPNCFQKEEDVQIYVKSWIKLQELIFVLGSSLKEIENRWEDGKGPLASCFTVEELRSLVKALFQNTQYRANFLSKLK